MKVHEGEGDIRDQWCFVAKRNNDKILWNGQFDQEKIKYQSVNVKKDVYSFGDPVEGLDETARFLRNNYYHIDDKSMFIKVNSESLIREKRPLREFEKVQAFIKDLMDLDTSPEQTIETLLYDKVHQRYVVYVVDTILNTMTTIVGKEIKDTKYYIRNVKPHVTYLHENFNNVYYETGCMVVSGKYKKKMSREHFNELKVELGVAKEDTYWKRANDERLVVPRLIETNAGFYIEAVELETDDVIVEKQYIGFGKFAVMCPSTPVVNSTDAIHTPERMQNFKVKVWEENCVHRIYEYQIEWDSGKLELKINATITLLGVQTIFLKEKINLQMNPLYRDHKIIGIRLDSGMSHLPFENLSQEDYNFRNPITSSTYQKLMKDGKLMGISMNIKLSHLALKKKLTREIVDYILRQTERTILNMVPKGRIIEEYLMREFYEPDNKIWLLRPEEKYGGMSILTNSIQQASKVTKIFETSKPTTL